MAEKKKTMKMAERGPVKEIEDFPFEMEDFEKMLEEERQKLIKKHGKEQGEALFRDYFAKVKGGKKKTVTARKGTMATKKKTTYSKGGAAKRPQMMKGGMANGKKHMYAAGGSVMENLTSGQRRMVQAMARDNKKA